MNKTLLIVALASAGVMSALSIAHAQVAGASTTSEVSVTETTQIARGWSVKKAVLGKAVYNDAGAKIGKVDDLIISPDRNISYAIIGAGGFIGMGRHDVAIPVAQIRNEAGKLVMPGATKETIKALPTFSYASDTAHRDAFIAKADTEIENRRKDLAALEKRASGASAESKLRMDKDIAAAHGDLKTAEAKLAAMKAAAEDRWKELEAGVVAANERLKRTLERARG